MGLVRASGGYYERTTNLPSLASYSMAFWCKLGSSGAFNNGAWSIKDGSNNLMYRCGSGGTDMEALTNSAAAGVALITMTVGTWYYFAASISGTAIQHYVGTWDAASLTNISDTWSGSTITAPTNMYIGVRYDTFGALSSGGSVAGLRIWTAVLSQAELEAERFAWFPRRWTNIHAWYPTWSGSSERLKDYGGNGYNLSQSASGTFSDADNPTVPYGNPTLVYAAAAAPAPSYVPPNVLSNMRPNNLGGF